MELREIEMFLAVARELHFGRAAEALHVSQPTLSQAIQRLENAIGVRLFERTTRRVSLSDAGRTFEEAVQGVLSDLDAAVVAAQGSAGGMAGMLRVGFPTLYPGSVLPRLAMLHRERHPGVELRPQIVTSREQLKHIREGMLDAGFIWGLSDSVGELEHLEWVELSRHPIVAALPESMPLAASGPVISLEDLRAEPFVTFPATPELGSVVRDATFAACRDAGFVPQVVHEIPGYQVVLELVGSGMGVSLLPDAITTVDVPGVVIRSLDLEPRLTFLFVTRPSASSTLLRDLHATVLRLIELRSLLPRRAHGHATPAPSTTSKRP